MNQVNKEEEKQIDIWADSDLAELLFASEENRESEIIIRQEAREEKEEYIEAPDIQDPELAHDLYHKTLQPLLRGWLLNATPEARSMIREQVNLLLKDGHTRGRDGKQAYYYRLQQAIDIIHKWENLCSAQLIPPTESRYFRLFVMFKDTVEKIKVKLD